MKPLFGLYARPHFVGIGGAGMEVLARLVAGMGCRVSGSDLRPSAALSALQRDGFRVQVGHGAEAVADADLVVYSTAVPGDNPELRRAREASVPLVSRAALLGALSRLHLTVAVAGSHGKTTTASMLAAILERAGWEPSVAVGAWRDGAAQGRLGRGSHFVVEADEYRRAFLELCPAWAVVTNVDAEHLDCYADLAAIEAAFATFIGRLPFYGCALVGGDGLVGEAVTAAAPVAVETFGMGPDNTWQAAQVELQPGASRFEIRHHRQVVAQVKLHVPGRHNVLDALGAAAAALRLGVAVEPLAEALEAYAGAARRFEVRARVGGVTIVDDYAHHPTELAAALAAARVGAGRVLAVFQPHLYSRTRLLHAQFSAALRDADEVFLAPVYGAREAPEAGVGSELIAAGLRQLGHGCVHLLPAGDQAAGAVLAQCGAGDTVLVMGAGDIGRLADELAGLLGARGPRA